MMSLVSSKTVVLIVSVLRPMSSFYVPCKVMVISAIVVWGLVPLFGRSPAGLLVNTDLNFSFNSV